MDIYEIRLARLTVLLQRHRNNKAELARSINKAPAQVSQWFASHRRIGESVAREIEDRLRLGEGWMDRPLSLEEEPPKDRDQPTDPALEGDATTEGSALWRMIGKLPDNERHHAMNELRLQLLNARRAYTPREFDDFLGAIDRLDGSRASKKH